jgi:hypothetical protein
MKTWTLTYWLLWPHTVTYINNNILLLWRFVKLSFPLPWVYHSTRQTPTVWFILTSRVTKCGKSEGDLGMSRGGTISNCARCNWVSETKEGNLFPGLLLCAKKYVFADSQDHLMLHEQRALVPVAAGSQVSGVIRTHVLVRTRHTLHHWAKSDDYMHCANPGLAGPKTRESPDKKYTWHFKHSRTVIRGLSIKLELLQARSKHPDWTIHSRWRI